MSDILPPRIVSRLTPITRIYQVPPHTGGQFLVGAGAKVDLRDEIARGDQPAEHILIDVAAELDRPAAEAFAMIGVEAGAVLEEGDFIAGRNPERGRRVLAPAAGQVKAVDARTACVVFAVKPAQVTLRTGVRGRVREVRAGSSMVIDGNGALVQGVWGNGRQRTAILRSQPDDGLQAILRDQIDLTYKGCILVIHEPIGPIAMDIVADQGLTGMIAPSMDATLIPAVMASPAAILLVDGFGPIPMARNVKAMLTEFEGFQATIEAQQPRFGEAFVPQMVINRVADDPIRPMVVDGRGGVGVGIRVAREPYLGRAGRIIEWPPRATLLENGLEVPCVRVELDRGERAVVPLANLEMIGR
jgi:hypothetical protein